MQIDKGWYVNNFVGTYEIVDEQDAQGQNYQMIVSKQVNHADIKQGERSLRKKRIFESDGSKGL